MAAKSNRNLTTLDFDSIKNNLKTFLRNQDIFQDYDFEASNINVLLDVLAYNTYQDAFYLNMLGAEMFLDSALLRDSVVSHAKELNYVPRSFRSSSANVNITIVDTQNPSVLIPKGTSFTGTAGNKNFTFVTAENISVGGSNNTFIANNVTLYEGDYTVDSYTMNYTNPVRFIVKNKTVDTNSLTVTVIEDNGATVLPYTRSDSLFGLSSVSQAFFVQAAENDTYEIVFGDNVIGRKPKDRAVVTIQYRNCNGELPNGIKTFRADGKINGTGVVTNITVNSAASGGSIPESISSIKFNAPRAFTTQERAVTSNDYETLLKQNFSEINAVSAYGGEESWPPQFGKVVVAVDLRNTNILPPSKSTVYKNFLKARSPLAIDPVFVSPEYTYVKVNSTVKYNINKSSLNKADIESLVSTAIMNYNVINLNGFNKTLNYSKFVAAIDNAQFSIVSNDTEVQALKIFEPVVGSRKDYVIDFGIELRSDLSLLPGQHDPDKIHVLSSSAFMYNGLRCHLEDDGVGIVRIMTPVGEDHVKVKDVGTINYATGIVNINNFELDSFVIGNSIDVTVRAAESDITSQRRTILDIREQDIDIEVVQVRL